MKSLKIGVATALVCLVSVVAAQAQEGSKQSATQQAATNGAAQAPSPTVVPRLIKFSGTLLDAQQRPLAGPVGVTFALYAQQAGGAALWLETQNVEPDAYGLYTVLLGVNSANGVPTELFVSGEARWLEVQVERQAAQPRVLLVSVPYALKAGDAETLGGLPASAFVTTGTPADAANAAAATTAKASSSTAGGLPKSSLGATPKKAGSTPQTATPCSTVTSDGAAAVNSIALFTTACNVQSSLMTQTLVNGFPGVNVAGNNAGLLLSGAGTHQVTVTGATSGRLGQDANGFFFASDTNGSSVRFLTNNGALNEWMRITSAGNVGIGTTTPAATLDVVSAATTGNLFRVAGPMGGLRVQSNATSPNIVSGFSGNTVGTAVGATISGGGNSGNSNNATGNYSTVSGGLLNFATGLQSTVSGGDNNNATGDDSTVSGGISNASRGGVSTVSGGNGNHASAGFATVSGGQLNTASGLFATVSGGQSNTAQGQYSFAAGRQAQALHDGTFVWGDNTNATFSSTAVNQFLIRASSGVGIGTGSPSHQLEVVDASNTGLRVQTNTPGGTVASFGGNGEFQIDAPGVVGGRLIVKENGAVGVGTTTPSAQLTVNSNIFGLGPGVPGILIGNPSGTTAIWQGKDSQHYLELAWLDPTHARLFAGGGMPLVFQEFGGNVGIGTTAPDNLLTVNGTADKPGGGSWGTFSDGRLKNVYGSFRSGLKQVLQLNPIRYQYKEENPIGIHDSQEHIGLVAQEVERVIPEAVSANAKGYLLVNNDPILWSMLNAIKEQQREILAQQKQLQAQTAELAKLKARLERRIEQPAAR
jgi:hypothetical protein